MTDKTKNITNLESQTAKKISDIKKTDEMTMSDSLKSALNESNYMRAIVTVAIKQKNTVGDIIKAILESKTALDRSKTKNKGYQNKSDVTDSQKVTKRVYGWLSHYSHLRATDVKKTVEVINADGETVKNRANIKNDCHIIDFKSA